MSENFEKYSETDWANDFLVRAQNQFPDNESRMKFRGFLDKNNIQENEADDFLQAYKKGDEATEKFLLNRSKREVEREPVFPLSEKKEIPDQEHHKTAA